MKERGILFSGSMVRAILDGSKTQTRRIVRDQPPAPGLIPYPTRERWAEHCPYGAPGDRLWVRETHALVPSLAGCERIDRTQHHDQQGIRYRATWDKCTFVPWRPSIFMPRWASRLTLEIASIRVERLQEITEDDARAEGVQSDMDWISKIKGVRGAEAARVVPQHLTTARENYRWLWNEINGKRAAWASNPWVWAITFRRVAA